MVTTALLSEIETILAREPVDEVFITLPRETYGAVVNQVIRVCEEQGIIVRLWADTFQLHIAKSHVDELLDGTPVMTIQSGPSDGWQIIIKRLVDIVGSLALLVTLLPLLAVIALCIKLTSPGPIFFSQERVGINKRRFRLLKFRTMVQDAEDHQQQLEHLNDADGPVFKIRADPRVTRVGAVLRRFSLDELPQLLNILRGDMSLVGPRPLPLRDVNNIHTRWHKRRFSVKPGLTGLWQVNGRSNVSFDHWVRMDLEYIDHWSLSLDLKIMLKTIPAVLKGSGAY